MECGVWSVEFGNGRYMWGKPPQKMENGKWKIGKWEVGS